MVHSTATPYWTNPKDLYRSKLRKKWVNFIQMVGLIQMMRMAFTSSAGTVNLLHANQLRRTRNRLRRIHQLGTLRIQTPQTEAHEGLRAFRGNVVTEGLPVDKNGLLRGKNLKAIHEDDLVSGTRLFCLFCDSHLITLSEDVYQGEPIHSGQFKPDEGQRFDPSELLACKLCCASFNDRGLYVEWETPC